ncbi:MAG: (2Fe-2S) ferredoxin domain-containing protein [Elusimicrobia bacterium]|nr:(2Fe-2S) ferredoxin domain-containing protein [Elusimicrobiota bacterium]
MATPHEIVTQKRAAALQRLAARGYDAPSKVFIGMATCEIAAGSKEVMEVFQEALKGGLKNVYVSQKGCFGRCNLEPTVDVIKKGKKPVTYGKVTVDRAKEIIEKHIIGGKAIAEYIIK